MNNGFFERVTGFIDLVNRDEFKATSANHGAFLMSKEMPKELQPHEKRVLDEHSELCEKIGKLADFLSKPQPSFIDDDQWFLLNAQLSAMSLYSNILSQRTKAFFK